MDKIIMKDMIFFAHHGVLEEEKKLGQKFIVSAYLFLPLKEAGIKDDLKLTVNYGKVYEVIRDIVQKEKFDLLEGVAQRICDVVLSIFQPVEKIIISIKKPEAPVPGAFDYFAVEIERNRYR